QYPYAAAGTTICAPIPDWAQEGGPSELLARLADRDTRACIRSEMETRDALLGRIDFEAIEVNGRRIAEIARERGRDPFDVYFEIVAQHRANLFVIFHSMSEADVRVAMQFPWVSIASDAEATSKEQCLTVHPRAYGTFPRVLGRYVREE